MSTMNAQYEIMDDWETLISFLPEGWREQAKERKALWRRGWEVQDPEVLLRILLIHLAQGYSLKETSVRVKESGLASMSGVAIYKRLRRSGEWLRWMAEGVLKSKMNLSLVKRGKNLRPRMVDATTVSEPGSTGSDWRLHYALRLMPLQCDFFELTDVHGGESLTRIPIARGDLVLGDRAYADAKGVAHVLDGGGDALVRMRVTSFRMLGPGRKRFQLMTHLKKLRIGEVGEWQTFVVGNGNRLIPGRICALKRSKKATDIEIKRLRRKYSKQRSKTPGPKALAAARYICVFTTVDASLLSASDVMELYRARWQIELAFKRLKSIVNFGHLPKQDLESAKAWLYGKLLVSLLAEVIVEAAHSFSPWGYVKINGEKAPAASLCGKPLERDFVYSA
jgi:hypothetical protein